jgi:hypothetical protein
MAPLFRVRRNPAECLAFIFAKHNTALAGGEPRQPQRGTQQRKLHGLEPSNKIDPGVVRSSFQGKSCDRGARNTTTLEIEN